MTEHGGVRYECWYAEPSTGPLVVIMGHDSGGWFEAASYSGASLDECTEQVASWIRCAPREHL